MKFYCKKNITSLFFLYIIIFISPNILADEKSNTRKTTIFMAGDSTMAIKETKDYPETGWGVPFSSFFEDDISVKNYAKNGRSTRTFISEGLWGNIIKKIHEGDYVFIQFGHNDESITKKDRYTTPNEYKKNLARFIKETQEKGANPILLTPITRRYFSKNGKIRPTHSHYQFCMEVGKKHDIPFIDMDLITRNYFTAIGDKASALRFMHIPPNTHPNYPFGVRDNTHTNHLGAREVAQLVLAELKKIEHPLAHRLRIPDPKHLTLKY